MSKERNYPYCNNCDSCGHDECCSYIKCTIDSINRSKNCLYKETTKAEMMLRHLFYKYILEETDNSDNEIIKEFVDKIFDKAYLEAFPEPIYPESQI